MCLHKWSFFFNKLVNIDQLCMIIPQQIHLLGTFKRLYNIRNKNIKMGNGCFTVITSIIQVVPAEDFCRKTKWPNCTATQCFFSPSKRSVATCWVGFTVGDIVTICHHLPYIRKPHACTLVKHNTCTFVDTHTCLGWHTCIGGGREWAFGLLSCFNGGGRERDKRVDWFAPHSYSCPFRGTPWPWPLLRQSTPTRCVCVCCALIAAHNLPKK